MASYDGAFIYFHFFGFYPCLLLRFVAKEGVGIVAEEAGAHDVFAAEVDALARGSGCGGGGSIVVEQPGELHGVLEVFHDAIDLKGSFGGCIDDGGGCIEERGRGVVGHEGFHSSSAGTDEGEHGVQQGIVEEGATHGHGFVVAVEVVYIDHHESGGGHEALAVAPREGAAGGNEGQQRGFGTT